MDSRCTAQVVSTIDDTTTSSSRASWGLFWIVHIVHISLNEHIVQLRLVGTLGKPLAIVLGGRPPPVVRCLNTEPQPQVVTSDSSLARRFYQFCFFFLHFRQKKTDPAFLLLPLLKPSASGFLTHIFKFPNL